MSAALADKRIGIIGAGPGGLTCARILQRHGIPVTVYDRDPDAHSRNQGGSLDLHDDDGQLALDEAGLLDEFFGLARLDGQEMRQMNPAGRILAHHVPAEGEKSSKPRVRVICDPHRRVLVDHGRVRAGRVRQYLPCRKARCRPPLG